ncbi:hypothetical protein SAMN04488062_1302 [Flavobacterium omnivorum]|uniref:Uncharacterized protein n=1 Tax=Flavobacterium omnivorum TaxID=178355 RepID=A0A1G8IX92_9FLAO|nr:hypothetical protein SAMN04488062_1302 [Flavobacterium omnivorum]
MDVIHQKHEQKHFLQKVEATLDQLLKLPHQSTDQYNFTTNTTYKIAYFL